LQRLLVLALFIFPTFISALPPHWIDVSPLGCSESNAGAHFANVVDMIYFTHYHIKTAYYFLDFIRKSLYKVKRSEKPENNLRFC